MSVSLNMIVKNEQRCIERCLRSVVNLVDEMVIVDTGSNDNTIPIIRDLAQEKEYSKKIKLIHFDWCDDFAKARNFGLMHCTSKYILALDADEFIHENEVSNLRNILNDIFKTHIFYMIPTKITNIMDRGREQVDLVNYSCRIFPNHKLVKYKRKIHESIDFVTLLRSKVVEQYRCSFRIFHDGYDESQVNLIEKKMRNLTILQELMTQDPNDLVSAYYFAIDSSRFDLVGSKRLMKYVLVNSEKDSNGQTDFLKRMSTSFLESIS